MCKKWSTQKTNVHRDRDSSRNQTFQALVPILTQHKINHKMLTETKIIDQTKISSNLSPLQVVKPQTQINTVQTQVNTGQIESQINIGQT